LFMRRRICKDGVVVPEFFGIDLAIIVVAV